MFISFAIVGLYKITYFSKGILRGYKYTAYDKAGNIPPEHNNKEVTGIDTKITIETDGEWKIEVKAIDEAGNESATHTVNVGKDTVAPIVEGLEIPSDKVTDTSFQVSVGAKDDTSGIDRYEYWVNGSKKTENGTGTITIDGLTPKADNTIFVRVYDKSGKYTDSVTRTITTKGELKAPTVAVSSTSSSGSYLKGTVTVKISDNATSDKTRATRIRYIENGTSHTVEGTSHEYTITTDGDYTVIAYMQDGSGIESTGSNTATFTRDTTGPTISRMTTGSIGTSSVRLTATASDSLSGISTYRFDYKPSSSSSWTNRNNTKQQPIHSIRLIR